MAKPSAGKTCVRTRLRFQPRSAQQHGRRPDTGGLSLGIQTRTVSSGDQPCAYSPGHGLRSPVVDIAGVGIGGQIAVCLSGPGPAVEDDRRLLPAWVQAKLDGEWVILDAVATNAGWATMFTFAEHAALYNYDVNTNNSDMYKVAGALIDKAYTSN